MDYFVCIGAQKAGTTWLHTALSAVPAIGISPVKELHFFGARDQAERRPQLDHQDNRRLQRFLQRALRRGEKAGEAFQLDAATLMHLECAVRQLRMRTAADYRSYFENLREITGARVVGEITPAYSTLTQAQFGEMAALFPGARFLMILRNPADRVWSHARFDADKRDEAPEDVVEFAQRPGVAERTRYDITLSRLRAVVSPGQIHVGFYEHLFGADGPQQLRRIVEFLLGPVDFTVSRDLFATRSNASPAQRMPARARAALVRQYRMVYEFAAGEFGSELPASWSADLASMGARA